ncbi:putative 115 kDa protein in type-1 retrotransposable element R1DM [Trichonephila clavipes]|nr:putative 115 kDa protein in type-1 retrotransposable element R1DM [Trichonephila clavipes]
MTSPDEIWILCDSRSAIQHLSDWTNVGDKTSVSILKNLKELSQQHEIYFQWIPSHIGLFGNDTADLLAKEELWKTPPTHPWYNRQAPGGALSIKADRVVQTTISRLASGHIRGLSFNLGQKIYENCTKCNLVQATQIIFCFVQDLKGRTSIPVLFWCLVLRGTEEVFGSPHYSSFMDVLGLLHEFDPFIYELIEHNITDDPPFTIHEIDAVVNKLKLIKAPGPDSIPNEVVKKLHEMYPDLFLIVFNSCLRLKTFPCCWKKARIILTPKVNDVRVPNLDNLRCISLLSTLGKCFERLITNRVAWRLYIDNYFNKNQFGFMPQEDALVKLNEIVLKGKKRNLHTILVLFDIKGAFDNAWWPGILSLLNRSNIPGNLFAVISSFLKDRSVTLSLGHSSKEKFLNKGCPQGSLSGPFLWNVIINDFLEKILAFSSCETIAFADDLLLCFQGNLFMT